MGSSDGDPCPGFGECHGCLKWCESCGDVDAMCPHPPCMAHYCEVCKQLASLNEGVCDPCHHKAELVTFLEKYPRHRLFGLYANVRVAGNHHGPSTFRNIPLPRYDRRRDLQYHDENKREHIHKMSEMHIVLWNDQPLTYTNGERRELTDRWFFLDRNIGLLSIVNQDLAARWDIDLADLPLDQATQAFIARDAGMIIRDGSAWWDRGAMWTLYLRVEGDPEPDLGWAMYIEREKRWVIRS